MTEYRKILLLISVILPLLPCFPVEANSNQEQKEITVVFRFDDPSALSCTEIEDKLIAAFRRHNMCCTFGVIPFVCAGDGHDPASQDLLPLTPAKVEMLRQAAQEGVLEIALHGYSHQTNGLTREGYSEFAGLDYEEQLQRIKQGKQFLEEAFEIPVITFVPPWNSYDSNTMKALELLGFRCLSSDLHDIAASSSSSLKFLPVTCGLADVENAIEMARNTSDLAPIVVILFHEYDFREVNNQKGKITYDDFLKTLNWLSQQQDVDVLPIEDLENLSITRFMKNQRLRKMQRFLPGRLHSYFFPYVYLSEKGIRSVRLRCIFSLTGLYWTTLLAVGTVTCLSAKAILAREMKWASKYLLASGPVALAVIVGYAILRRELNPRILMLMAVAAGYCVGMAYTMTWCRYRTRRQ